MEKRCINNMKIAILGATSHIAKGLIYNFNQEGNYELFLFARSIESVQDFLRSIQCEKGIHLRSFDKLNKEKYDVIINCIGISSSSDFKERVSSYFRLTEQFDNLVIDYINDHPDTLYINFSSGAVYGTDFSAPVDESTCSRWDINHITEADYYGIAKLNSEAKHRALRDLNIVDLRVFGYFSRFIDLKSCFLLAEIISCVKKRKEFVTTPDNIVRDYIHPKDLMLLIKSCINKFFINYVFDVYSFKPVAKFEILDYFVSQYGLKCTVKESIKISAVTGIKNNYYSNSRKAEDINYKPQFTSMDSIIQESLAILGI
ncbi:NAD(P)-dependent oxidoreductase [bacterium]|nr:NAD(P)-dependent oxidoreductase [bacterium]MBU1754307.1 NAD(P)-dependent oxidoreductase [bacterium]